MSSSRNGPPKIDGMISLKVDNLTYRTTVDDLKKVFERCGKVGDVYIPRFRNTKGSRGFAFVRFYDRRDAKDALHSMNGRILDGRELRVQMALYGRPNSPNGRRRRTRRSYSRSVSRSRSRSRSRGHGGGGGGGGGGSSSNRRNRRSYSRSRSRSSTPRAKRSRAAAAESKSKSKSRSLSRSRSKSF